MTERDLLEYMHCEREISKLRAKYREEEDKLCCPRAPSMDGMPRGAGSDDPFLDILDRRRRYKERIDRLVEDRLIAERRLDRVYGILTSDLERDVFDALYREGKSISDIHQEMHYSKSHIYLQRARILEAVKDAPA